MEQIRNPRHLRILCYLGMLTTVLFFTAVELYLLLGIHHNQTVIDNIKNASIYQLYGWLNDYSIIHASNNSRTLLKTI